MPKGKTYSREPSVADKAVKAQGTDVRASFKNTYNSARVLRGMTLKQAETYLGQVIDHKRCIPFRRFNRSTGRCSQAKEFGLVQGRWPVKSCRILLSLIKNLEANANVKQLNIDDLVITHVQVNRAQKGRRRTYRAHGRITPFLSSPFHIELWAIERSANVTRAAPSDRLALSRKQVVRNKLRVVTTGEN